MAPLAAMSLVILAGLASLTGASRIDREDSQGVLSQEELTGGCRSMVKAITICVQPGDGKFFLANLAGHAAEDLNCMSTWCAAKKDVCCATVKELKQRLDGQSPSSTSLGRTVFDKLQAAASTPAGEVPDADAQAPAPLAEPAETTVAPVEGSAQATGGGDIDETQCMCLSGTRGVNLAGMGAYDKGHLHIKGADGGKCKGSCDTCTRVFGGSRLPCCERTVDGNLGKCGQESKAPQFGGAQCLCGGMTVQKEQLYRKNDACLPEARCSACGHNCV